MSQGLRDMMSNRKFSIPLIILLVAIFVGASILLLVLILRPAAENGPVAQATQTPTEQVTPTASPTSTSTPTNSPTPSPRPTLVPVGTPSGSEDEEVTPTETTGAGTEEPTSEGTPSESATETPTSEGTPSESATETPSPSVPEEDELAQTGVGWGVFVIAGVGLAVLVLAARRVRLVG